MEWKAGTLSSILKINKEKLIFLFCSGLLLFILSIPNDGGGSFGFGAGGRSKQDIQTANGQVQAADGNLSAVPILSAEQELELRVRELLSGVEGVGELDVMIFFKEEKEMGFYGNDGTEDHGSQVSGIIISADGGGSSVVKTEISQAMEALFDLPPHKIKVLKRVKKESEE